MTHQKLLGGLVRSLLSASLLIGNVPAHAAVDGVEFQPVPVNIANRCSAVILKGTNKYRGYAFKLPWVLPSVNKNYEDLFEIIPKGNGQYTLRFALFFSMTEEPVELRRERSNLFINTCSDNVILADLNEAEQREIDREGKKADPKKADGTIFENKPHTLSPLPLSQVEVSIDGFQNMTKIIGQGEDNILNYQNQDLPVDFLIPDEQTYEEIKAHLTGNIGLALTIRMNFAAKSVNGRTELKMNVKNLADSLESALGGRLNMPGAENLIAAEADLRTFFARAIAKMDLGVRTEEGDNENFNRMSYEVVARIISANLSAVPMIPGQTWNPNSCVTNPTGPNCGGGYGGGYGGYGTGYGGTTYPGGDPTSTGTGTLTGSPQAGLGTPGPVLNTGNPDPAARYFKVGAVLNVLRSSAEQSFVWENFGKLKSHSYTTNVFIRGEIPDPGYKTMNVVAGTSDSEASTLPVFIKAGQEVAIKVPGKRELINKFIRRTTYLNKDEIRRQGLASHFGSLQEALSKNMLVEEISRERGGYVATYNQNSDQNPVSRWWNEFGRGLDMTQWKYTWGMDELQRHTTMTAPTDIDLYGERDLNRLPLRVSFGSIATRYKLSDLAKSNKYWDGRFEDGQIFIVARQDLGQMKIRNDEKAVNPNRSAEKYLFEVREPKLKANQRPTDGKTLADLRQFSFVKFSTGSGPTTETVGRPSLTPFETKKSVYVVMIRVAQPGGAGPLTEEVRTTIDSGGSSMGGNDAPSLILPSVSIP